MIKNNFSRICGERRIKITDIAHDTGISRTTLTALYYDRLKGISFGVLDKLCSYFDCNVGDLFEVVQ